MCPELCLRVQAMSPVPMSTNLVLHVVACIGMLCGEHAATADWSLSRSQVSSMHSGRCILMHCALASAAVLQCIMHAAIGNTMRMHDVCKHRHTSAQLIQSFA